MNVPRAMHSARRHFLLALVYAAALWTPAVHDHFLEEEACADCAAILAAGPQIIPPCDPAAPCRGDHHHHHGHVHGQCLSCHALAVVGLPAGSSWSLSAAIEIARQTSCGGKSPSQELPLGLYHARAPPAHS